MKQSKPEAKETGREPAPTEATETAPAPLRLGSRYASATSTAARFGSRYGGAPHNRWATRYR